MLYVGMLSWGPWPLALLRAQAAPGPPCSQNRVPTAPSSPRSGHRPPGFPQPRGRRWAVLNQSSRGRPSTSSRLRKAHPSLQSREPGNAPEAAPFGTDGLLILRVPTHPSIHPVSKHPSHIQEQNKACAWGSVCWGELAVPQNLCAGLCPKGPLGSWGPSLRPCAVPTPVHSSGGAERCVLGAQ